MSLKTAALSAFAANNNLHAVDRHLYYSDFNTLATRDLYRCPSQNGCLTHEDFSMCRVIR